MDGPLPGGRGHAHHGAEARALGGEVRLELFEVERASAAALCRHRRRLERRQGLGRLKRLKDVADPDGSAHLLGVPAAHVVVGNYGEPPGRRTAVHGVDAAVRKVSRGRRSRDIVDSKSSTVLAPFQLTAPHPPTLQKKRKKGSCTTDSSIPYFFAPSFVAKPTLTVQIPSIQLAVAYRT